MIMSMLCRICRCFAKPEPSAKPDAEERTAAKGQAPDKNPEGKELPRT